jgi:hypothetical protein
MAGQNDAFLVTILNGTNAIEILPPIPTYANIPASQANTPTPNKKLMFGYATVMSIYCPATMPETIVLQTDPLESGQTWFNEPSIVLSAGTKVNVPMSAFKSARLFASSGNVAADRQFRIAFQYDMAT